ncbi:MAG: fumarylacetoacetate hydrolase family protein, partial [Octadecabacter sp.]
MQWARAQKGDGTEVTGVLVGDMLHPRASLGSETATGEAIALGELTLLAPVKPGKFIGLWNNYKAAAEKGGMQHPEHPLYFCKADTSLIGQGGQVVIPPSAGRVIFEGELGVVIGQTCKNITPEQAEDAIFGYTCINDFTSIDILYADPSFPQWTRAKSFDGFGVAGPVIETDFDWRDLTIKVLVNDRERQSYPAADMILSPAQIVSCLSKDMTIHAGDL